MVRLFGVEAHYFQLKTGDNLVGVVDPVATWSWTGFAFGLSPISIATNRDDPAGFGFEWFEPFVLYRTGSVTSPGTPSFTHSAVQVGNRFALDFPLGGSVRGRIGLDVSADLITNDGGHAINSGSAHLAGVAWAGPGVRLLTSESLDRPGAACYTPQSGSRR